ncbi:unnamed protein product [Rotaria sp. Silwood1]|nr:unnamed protein product [Rotaria sp. Silwood1]CAF3670282.1 unnamed protein product [Rotaria sp. Silwood1]CAF3676318.1 unnamed protein product [Rotaria sp. Silwood1]CAF3698926.1 unnamed protein product [Rotaria sp. Silwood1]CAF3756893.1 unnamed protein product [Rotaria sp. Silwood1]
MHPNNLSNELSIDVLTHDFNSRSFLLSLRRQNEKHREICTSEHDRQHPSKYCSYDNSRGFTRLNKYHNSYVNSSISFHIISENGIIMTDDLSKQLLDDNLLIVRRHWQKSKILFSNKIKYIQSDLSSKTNISLKKAMYECQGALFNWISKNRLR